MRLVKARPLVEEVALSGFGEDDEFGRRGGRRGGGRRGGGRRSGGRRGGGKRGRMRRRSREEEDEDTESEEVSGRKERKARRKLRRKQRSQRQSLRAKQKLKKSRGGRRKKSRRSAGGSSTASSTRRSSHSSMPSSSDYTEDFETTEESSTSSRPRRGRMMRRRMQQRSPRREQRYEQPYEDEEEFIEDDFLEDPFEEDLEYEIEDEALEGTRLELGRAVRRGLLAPGAARKVLDRVRSQLREGRARRQERRSANPATPAAQPLPNQQLTAAPGWNPPGAMGRNLQVQARSGHRAAVMELREGLYLVADVSSSTTMPSTQGEDVGAILPALMVRAAAKAIQRRRQNRTALDALQPRQLPGPTHQSAPLQLHGPIAGCSWSD